VRRSAEHLRGKAAANRLRACPLPANVKVTKPRNPGFGWGGERTNDAAEGGQIAVG